MIKKDKKRKLTKKQTNVLYYGVIIVILGFVFTMAYVSFKPVLDWNQDRRSDRSLFD